MKIWQTFSVVTLAFIVSVGFYFKLNSEEIVYTCTPNSIDLKSMQSFLSLKEKHPFKIWDSSDGQLRYEVYPKKAVIYKYSLDKNNQLKIFENNMSLESGSFIKNNNLSLNTKDHTFVGTCNLIKTHCVNNILH